MKRTSEITMEVTKKIGAVGTKYQLNMVSWNGAEPKIDLRNWYKTRDGVEKCSKGLTLSNEEAKDLRDLLNDLDLD